MGKGKKGTAADAEKAPDAQQTAEAETAKFAKKAKKAQAASAAAQPPEHAAASTAPAAEAEAAGQLGKKRAAKDEIDAIFASSKKSAAAEPKAEDQLNPELQQVAAEVEAARLAAQASGKRPKVEGSKDDIFGQSTGKSRKRTEEGYAVYSEEELGMGRKGGGDTPLCPFDCECCF